MYVCARVCIKHVCCLGTYIHKHTHTRMHTHSRTQAQTNIHTHAHFHTHIHTHIHTHRPAIIWASKSERLLSVSAPLRQFGERARMCVFIRFVKASTLSQSIKSKAKKFLLEYRHDAPWRGHWCHGLRGRRARRSAHGERGVTVRRIQSGSHGADLAVKGHGLADHEVVRVERRHQKGVRGERKQNERFRWQPSLRDVIGNNRDGPKP